MGMKMLKKIICAVVLMSSSAEAEIGIEFSKMPAGCSWFIKYSNGNHWMETFIGKKKGLYVVETVNADQPNKKVKTTNFDSEGLMVYRNWPGQGWERFTPYSCFGVSSNCAHDFINADGQSLRIENQTVQRGKTFLVKSGVVGGEKYPDEKFVLGPYHLMVSNSSTNYSARIESFVNCDIGS
jgi:hypothetical protein